jgi:hypothetical protein
MNTTAPFKSQVKSLMTSCIYSQIAYYDHNQVRHRYSKESRKVARFLKYYDGLENGSSCSARRDAQGFLFKHKDKLVLSFRGTSTKEDILDAIDIRHVVSDSSGFKVHNGFYQQFKSVEPMITADLCSVKLSKRSKPREIVFTGHSMGGAIAAIAASYYGSLLGGDVSIHCHTFGTPMFADSKLGDDLLSQVEDHVCVFLKEDVIPCIPINREFTHLPRIIELDDKGTVSCRIDDVNVSYSSFLLKLAQARTIDGVFKSHSSYTYYARLYKLYQRLLKSQSQSTSDSKKCID